MWDRHAIRAEIHRRGSTLTRVALQAGLEAATCRVALNRPNRPGEAAIARFLGIPARVLWPERYLSRASRPVSGTRTRPPASQKSAEALT